jgi:hypothetical protein
MSPAIVAQRLRLVARRDDLPHAAPDARFQAAAAQQQVRYECQEAAVDDIGCCVHVKDPRLWMTAG